MDDTARRLSLFDTVSQVQRQFFQSEAASVVFGGLLEGLLSLMESEYGFIGEVKYEDNGSGRMYLQTHAITNIAWNAATRAFHDENIDSGLKFYNMNTLFGTVMTTKKPVISNNPMNDNRAGGIPKGHPPLNHFLGIPFFKKGGDLCGMVGISNKPGGYTEQDIDFLEPFLVTCSNLIQAYAQIRRNEELINTLECKVKERTRELELANQSLAEANRQVLNASKAQLQHFACMSHEIRTPLNCIIGMSSLMLETQLTPAQSDSMKMIVTAGELLLTVVNDVLDYSKLETGNVDIEIKKSNLQDTLSSVVHSIDYKAKEKRVRLRPSFDANIPVFVQTDGRRLQQILFNLLGNAVKFSKEDRDVELKVQLKETTNGFESTEKFIRFVVKDYGKGIDDNDFERIFKPFLQASKETGVIHEGTGLGLAITSKLVVSMGGKIWVDSRLGEWSEFTVDLPFRDEPVDVEAVGKKLQHLTVLLVDKDEKTSNWFTTTLAEYGIPYHEFKTMSQITILRPEQNKPAAYVCIVNERLFDETLFEAVRKRTNDPVLLTFGPNFSVENSAEHYRDPVQILPSLFIASMCESVEACKTPKQIPEEDNPPGAINFRDLNVLVAEDNIVNQKILSRMLQRLDIENVEVVDNGQKAVDRVSQQYFDVLLLDMQMPIMDGMSACKLIQKQKNGHPLPKVVFVTAQVSSAFEKECYDAGAVGFLAKPFNKAGIEKCLRSIYSNATF